MKFRVFYHSECLFIRPRIIIAIGDLVQSYQPQAALPVAIEESSVKMKYLACLALPLWLIATQAGARCSWSMRGI